MIAAPRLEVLAIAVIDEGIEIRHRLDEDITATPAVAAIRSAEFDELLAPEADGAGTAGTALDEDLGFIEEFHRLLTQRKRGMVQPLPFASAPDGLAFKQSFRPRN